MVFRSRVTFFRVSRPRQAVGSFYGSGGDRTAYSAIRRKENIIGEDDPNFLPFLVLLNLYMQRARAAASPTGSKPWGGGVRGVTPKIITLNIYTKQILIK